MLVIKYFITTLVIVLYLCTGHAPCWQHYTVYTCGKCLPVHAVDSHDGAWWIIAGENSAQFTGKFALAVLDGYTRAVGYRAHHSHSQLKQGIMPTSLSSSDILQGLKQMP